MSDIICNVIQAGVTNSAYAFLTKFRDGEEDDGLLITAGRRFVAEIGYAGLIVAGVIETVVRTLLAAIVHVFFQMAPLSLRKGMTTQRNKYSFPERIDREVLAMLNASAYITAITTLTCATNLINNICITKLFKHNGFHKQLDTDADKIKDFF